MANTSNFWKNTLTVLDDFSNLLRCEKCGQKLDQNTVKLVVCGHVLCKNCDSSNTSCEICGAYVPPTHRCPDYIVGSLTQDLNKIASLIKEGSRIRSRSPDIFKSPKHNAFNTSLLKRGNDEVDQKDKVKNKRKSMNKRNAKGETTLHQACLKGNIENVKILLKQGANPNLKDNAGWTPLQETINLGFYNISKILLEAGALPDIPGLDHRTALHEAAIGNKLREAELLLQFNAETEVFDLYGKKPIDYCVTQDMLQLFAKKGNSKAKTTDFNCSLNTSLITSNNNITVYASNINNESSEMLQELRRKHKINYVTTYKSSITNMIVEVNDQNIAKFSYDIMMALLHGKWILNSQWLSIGIQLDDITNLDFELFEILGCPVVGVPKRARENFEKQKPRLFNGCYFYFALQSKKTYNFGDIQLTRELLITLASEGEGVVLTREPKPETSKIAEQCIPFHVADNPSHPLYKCMYYIIYMPGIDEPRIKYNMSHIKTLPLIWFIECIEKFTLLDPTLLGLGS